MLIIKSLRYIPVIFLIAVVGVLAAANYSPGTWLTGWDNLHPEFDFLLNIKRSVFAVWQEYQGLGLLGGMAHAADLPRQIFLLVISIFIPNQLLRYLFHFLMLFIGVIGVYKILNDIILEHNDDSIRSKAGLLGALFYLLNLGTVQYFFVPFEPFSTFWGMFPWEMYVLFQFLKHPNRRNLLIFTLINFLAIPQAYVQTIFVVYLLNVVFVLGISIVKNKSWHAISTYIRVLLIIFCLNAFWLLPNLYFTFTKVQVTEQAMNNKMNTEKFLQANKKRGTLNDFILLREYYYDFLDYDKQSGELVYMMKTWRRHNEIPIVVISGYLFFGIIIFGLFKKNRVRLYLIGLFSLSSLLFLSDTPVISFINDFLRKIPLINQMFRNPFTKFIVPTVFVYSAGLGLGIKSLLNLNLLKENKLIGNGVVIVIAALIILYGYPSFRGELIYSKVRNKIPEEYFALFNYFKSQDKHAKIMNLPQDSYWGWGSYKWGPVGSGFLWYGIEQPILDRAFDVWSKESEDYYWQLVYAIKKKDQNLFNNILEKYQIAFIIFDPSYTPSDSGSIKSLLSQEDLLKNNSKLQLVAKFGSINAYRSNLENNTIQNIQLYSSLPSVIQDGNFSHLDEAFRTLGNYYKEENVRSADFNYPFGSLFTNRFQNERNFKIEEDGESFIFKTSIPKGKYSLENLSLIQSGNLIPVKIFLRKYLGNILIKLESIPIKIDMNGQEITEDINTKEIVIPGSYQSLILAVNGVDFFRVEEVGDNYKYIGSIFINNNNILANTFRIYTQTEAVYNLPNTMFFPAKQCSDVTVKDGYINVQKENDTLILQARKTSVCSEYQGIITNSIPNSLIETSFTYKSENDEYPQYCYWSNFNNRCLNVKDSNNQGFSIGEKKYTDIFEMGGLISENDRFSLILDPYNNENDGNIKQITYKDIIIKIYPLIHSFPIYPSEFIKNTNNAVRLDINKDVILAVNVSKIKSYYGFNDLLSINHFKGNNFAIDKYSNGDYYLGKTGNEALRFISKDTYLNFWTDIPNLNTSYGYLLLIDSKNLNNFPLAVNVSTLNDSNKYVYTFLSNNKDLYRNFFILPPINEYDGGLKIIFHNNSVNRTPTVNNLYGISAFPIPYNYLTKLRLKQSDTISTVSRKLPVELVKKENISYYETGPNVYPSIHNKKLMLVLSQSFDKGWRAYETECKNLNVKCKIQKILPFIFAKEIKDHVLVNNWENGWKLNSQSTVIIVYLPQYLEYLGLGFLLLTPLLLVGRKKFV